MAAGRLLIPSWMPALDGDGAPIPNARVFFYNNGTDVLSSVFSDEGLTVPLTNPVEANSSGRFPAIWASDALTYSWSIDAPYGPAGIPFTGDGLTVSMDTEILVLAATEAAADDADASSVLAQQAYQDILAFAEASPDAPSIVNKANLDGGNVAAAGQAAAFRTSIGAAGSAALAASTGSTLVGFLQSGTGAATRTVQDKAREIISPEDFTGTDTQKWQSALAAAPGKIIRAYGSYTITAALTVQANTQIEGQWSLTAGTGAGLPLGILNVGAVSGVYITGGRIDGNTNALATSVGSRYAIATNNTTDFHIDVACSNTKGAGLFMEGGQRGFIRVIATDCGRTGDTNAHGIQAFSIDAASPLRNIVIDGSVVTNAYRKGITLYADLTGVVENIDITGGSVTGCGIAAANGGGVYVGGAPTMAGFFRNIRVTGVNGSGNYINFQLARVKDGAMTGNTSLSSISEGYGIETCDSVSMAGNVAESSGVRAVYVKTSRAVDITGGVFTRSTALGTPGTNVAVLLDGCTECLVSQNIITDPDVRQAYGVAESGASNNNAILDNIISGTTAGLVLVAGVATAQRLVSGRALLGFYTTLQTRTALAGSWVEAVATVAVVNGQNNNVAVPNTAKTIAFSAPSAVYSISGFATPEVGRCIKVMNQTAFAMTLLHENASSTAANRIFCPTEVNLVIPAWGGVNLTYIGTRWFVDSGT